MIFSSTQEHYYANAHRFYDADNSHYAGLKATSTTTSSVDYTLPAAPPAANDYVLSCSTAGVMSWSNRTPANPSASVGLSAVNGSATTYMRSDAAPALSQSIAPDWTGFHSHRFDSMGTTPDDAKGILLYNSTAAAAGAQQISPAIRWRGQGWKTNSTAASQQVSFRAWVLPAQGAANPYGIWKLQASINEAAYSDVLTVSSAGLASVTTLTVSSTFNVIGAVGAVGLAYTDIAGNLQGLGWARGTIAVGGVANWETLAIGTSGKQLLSDGTDAAWKWPSSYTVWTKTASTTVSNTGTETTVLDTGVGSKTISGNTVRAGTQVRIKVSGTWGSKAAAVGNLTINFYVGGASQSVVLSALPASIAGTGEWQGEAVFTFRAIGASAACVGNSTVHYEKVGTADTLFGSMGDYSSTNVDTTGSLAVDVKVQWATANTSNTITATQASVELLNNN